jgi:hypothetical protein
MRIRDAVLFIVLMLLAAWPLFAQGPQPAAARAPEEVRAAEVLAALSKSTYTAKRPVPESENIFVDNGKLMEALYALARQEHPIAIPAGKPAAVSRVVLLDKAIHVFFAEDKCALLILTKENQSVRDLTVPELIDLAKKGVAALFTVKDAAKPVT